MRRWNREAPALPDSQSSERFSKYNVVPEVPSYTPELYEKDLVDPSWTKDETDYLMETYRECSGKWPLIIDRYESERPRTMEDLKARFYFISSRILSHQTPISSMTGPEYDLYETLKSFDPQKEASRKKLAEGHLSRSRSEVDEETVLLGELQRIMLHQSTLDAEREVSKRRSNWLGVALLTIFRIYVAVYIIHKQTATDTSTLPLKHSRHYGSSCFKQIKPGEYSVYDRQTRSHAPINHRQAHRRHQLPQKTKHPPIFRRPISRGSGWYRRMRSCLVVSASPPTGCPSRVWLSLKSRRRRLAPFCSTSACRN